MVRAKVSTVTVKCEKVEKRQNLGLRVSYLDVCPYVTSVWRPVVLQYRVKTDEDIVQVIINVSPFILVFVACLGCLKVSSFVCMSYLHDPVLYQNCLTYRTKT